MSAGVLAPVAARDAWIANELDRIATQRGERSAEAEEKADRDQAVTRAREDESAAEHVADEADDPLEGLRSLMGDGS